MIDHDVRIDLDLRRIRAGEDHPLGRGDVLRIRQTDYCYGNGPLTLRITALGADPGEFPALEWLGVAGIVLDPDGRDGEECHVLVRAELVRGVRVPGPPPSG